jgi:hypothetical protein
VRVPTTTDTDTITAATVDMAVSWGQCNASARTCEGVLKPRVCRGRPLSSTAVGGAPPGGRRGDRLGAGRVGGALQQPGQLGLQRPQAVQLAADLDQPPAQQGLGVAAGTLATVGDLEQLADLPQPQPARWAPFDQPQPANRVLVVEAVAGRRAGRWGSRPTRS